MEQDIYKLRQYVRENPTEENSHTLVVAEEVYSTNRRIAKNILISTTIGLLSILIVAIIF